MGKLHTETVAQYKVGDRTIDVELCWQGKEPEQDKDRFYDFYDQNGVCLNEVGRNIGGRQWALEVTLVSR